jgi:tellurite resistance protein TerC
MLVKKEANKDFHNAWIIRLLGKFFPITDQLEGDKFFVKKCNIIYITPLFAILLLVELTDIVFAIDSIPAIFSVTTDPFIVYTSNIFAILGLRNIYFVLCKVHDKFKFVKYGVAMILSFTGFKLFALVFDLHIPNGWSLAIILSLMAGSVIASVAFSSEDMELKY